MNSGRMPFRLLASKNYINSIVLACVLDEFSNRNSISKT